MKKLFSVLAVLFVLGTVNVFALGIGPEIGTNPGHADSFGGGGITFKIDNVPCVFAATGYLGSSGLSLGLTADWWIANPTIQGTWGYYYGLGLAGSVNLGDTSKIFVGGRALIGTNVFLLNKFMEIYLQAAWQPGIWLTDPIFFEPVGFAVNLGLRFWF